MDGKIDETFYTQKFNEYSAEKEKLSDAISKQSQNDISNIELKNAIFDLSQQGKEIYTDLEPEEKRKILKNVFQPFILSNGKIEVTLKEEFSLLEIVAHGVNSSNLEKVTEILNKIF